MSKENRVVTVGNTKSLSGLGNLGTVGGNAGTNQQGSGNDDYDQHHDHDDVRQEVIGRIRNGGFP
jgi:hypothetical protein